MTAQEVAQSTLIEDIVSFTHNPLGFCKYAYPWGEGELAGSQGPRLWQAEALGYLTDHLKNPATRHQPCRIAVCSGHGIGKSAFIAMVIDWALSTREGCRVIITANTFTQLDTKTAPEAAKWFRQSINSHWFKVAATSIKVKDPKHERTWRADFIPWSKKNPQAFAGLHNKGNRLVIVFDEASEIDDIIWETISGAMSDEGTEIIWLAFGNPTQNTGRFFECFGRFAHRWKTYQIDAREVEGTNRQEIAQDIEDWGDDSDYVRVRWLGKFPRVGFNQLIPSEAVANCLKYKSQGHESLPAILAVDVARFGDDQTVIGLRQGRKAEIVRKLRSQDTQQVARFVIEAIEQHSPDAVVVDADGIGAGVVDQLRHQGFGNKLFEFHGGGTPHDVSKYFNRRAEVWGLMRDALVEGMELPKDYELESDLTGPKYGFSNKQQIQLERKEDMKKRGLRSPDCGDMLAMTFAVKVMVGNKIPISTPNVYGESGWMA